MALFVLSFKVPHLRDRLRSGDVFIGTSRKFSDFNSLLLSDLQWEEQRVDFCSQMSFPSISSKRIDKRIEELQSLLGPLDQLLKAGGEIRLDEGVLVVPALSAEDIPPSAMLLREQINGRLPKVNITDIIKEVDSWTGFSQYLQRFGDEPRNVSLTSYV